MITSPVTILSPAPPGIAPATVVLPALPAPSAAAGNSPGASAGPSGTVFWREIVGAALAPSPAGTIGTAFASRASGNVEGQPGGYGRFVVLVHSSADGLLTIVNEDAPALTISFPVKAGVTVRLAAQAFGSSFRAAFNPVAGATVTLIDGYGNE